MTPSEIKEALAAVPHIRKIAGVSAAVIASAVALIAPWEGKATVGYKDIIGVPTYCYGGTGAEAKVGKRYTNAECQTQLAKDVVSHAAAMQGCITVPVPDNAEAAFISLTFNIGGGAFCRSTLVHRLNSHDLPGACAQISRYTYAGGKFVQGLANRRAAERALCEKDTVK